MTGEIQSHLSNGLQAHQRGDLATAGAHYQAVLKKSPDHPDALHLFGVLMLQSGSAEIAEQLIGRAIKSRPDQANYHSNYGMSLMSLGRLEDAVSAFENALDLDPGHTDALANLGGTLVNLGRFEDAKGALEKAIHLNPNHAAAKMNYGNALKGCGDLPAAEQSLREAIELNPISFEAHYNLAMALEAQLKRSAACRSARRAVLLNPAHFDICQLLGDLELYKPVSEIARLAFTIARCLDPKAHQPIAGLATETLYSGNLDASIELYKSSLERSRDDPTVRFNLGMAQLASGDFDEAWENYEFRLKRRGALTRVDAPPRWNGQSLKGKTIVIGSEQGVGDEILHASYIAHVIEDAEYCIIECSERLKPIYDRTFPAATVCTHKRSGDFHQPMQHYDWLPADPKPDYFIEVGSLPKHYWKTRAAQGGVGRFLEPDQARVDYYRSMFAGFGNELKIGFTWRSLFVTEDRAVFYTSLDDWQPVFQVPDISFICLQYGADWEHEANLARSKFKADIKILEGVDTTNDMDEVLAITEACDLIITPNGTVGWMGAAVDKETWMLVNTPTLFDQTGNPGFGYNSLKRFARLRAEPWRGPMERIANSLRAKVQDG